MAIKNRNEKEWMENLYNIKTFPFTYNNIADKNRNLDHNIEKYQLKQFVIAKFSIYAINFKSKNKSDGTFNYNFCLLNIYLVDEDLQPIFTFTKRKQGPDE